MTAENRFVRRWMSKNVQTISPDQMLIDAVELMRTHRIRHLPVVDDGKLVGIVSDRDVRHALPMRSPAAEERIDTRAALYTPIASAMTRYPITIDPDATIREAAEIICREKIGALPVVEDDKLVGIVSAEDLLWAFVESSREEEEEDEDAEVAREVDEQC